MASQDPLESQEEESILGSWGKSSPVLKMEQASADKLEFEEEDLTFNNKIEEGHVYYGHSVFDAEIQMEYQFDHHEPPPNSATYEGGFNVMSPPPPAPPTYACLVEGCGWRPNNTNIHIHRLRIHFLRVHLQNSPYACPVTGCSYCASNPSEFEQHLLRHLLNKQLKHKYPRTQNPKSVKGCSAEEMIGYLTTHYSNLQSKGIIIISPEEEDNLKLRTCEGDPLGIIKRMEKGIDLEAILQRDPVFIRTCEQNPGWEEQVLLIRTQSKDTRVPCPHCQMSFKSVRNYEIHKSQSHTPRPFQCLTCRRDFGKEHFLKIHLKSFDCAKEVPYMRRLEESLRWACTKCGLELLTPKQMKAHWLQAHQFRIPPSKRRKLEEVKVEKDELNADHGMENGIKINPDTGEMEGADICSIEGDPLSPHYGCEINLVAEKTPTPSSSLATENTMAPQDPLQSLEESRLDISEEWSGGNRSLTVKVEQEQQIDVKMEYDYALFNNNNYPPIRDLVPGTSTIPSYDCPVEGCGWVPMTTSTPRSPANLLSAIRGHFLRKHLQNSPYACPVPGCKVNAASLPSYEQHLNLHLSKKKKNQVCVCEKCGGSTLSKGAVERKHKCSSVEEMIGYLKTHYSNLQSNGILSPGPGGEELQTCRADPLGIKRMEERINLEAILKRDPVFLRTCKANPGWEDQVLLRRTQKDLSVECPACKKLFESEEHLKKHHLKCHSSRPKFLCTTCGREYKKEKFLKRHVKFFDCSRDMPYMRRVNSLGWICTKCGLKLPNPPQMKIHWLRAHQVKIGTTMRKRLKEVGVVLDPEREQEEGDLTLPIAEEGLPSSKSVVVQDAVKGMMMDSVSKKPPTNDHGGIMDGVTVVTTRNACPFDKGCGWIPRGGPYHLKQHFVKKHLLDNPYACPVPGCKTTVDTFPKFEKHLLKQHLSKTKRNYWTCEKCGQTFSNHKGMAKKRKHICSKISERNKSVKRCSRVEMIGYLKVHFSKLESKGLLSIVVGGNDDGGNEFRTFENDPLGIRRMEKRFNLDAILERDPLFIRAYQEIPGFRKSVSDRLRTKEKIQCPHCEMAFLSAEYLRWHLKKMHTPGPFQCSVCKRDYHREYLLKVHRKFYDCSMSLAYMRRLEESLRWTCTQCGEELISPAEMKKHWLGAHQISIPSTRKALLNESKVVELNGQEDQDQDLHLKKDDLNSKQFKNATADDDETTISRRFPRRKRKVKNFDIMERNGDGDLDKGKLEHSIVGNHGSTKRHRKSSKSPCPLCGKSFPSQKYLDWHLSKMHTPPRPFQCTTCHRDFAKEAMLGKHWKFLDCAKDGAYTMKEESLHWACTECGELFGKPEQVNTHWLEAHQFRIGSNKRKGEDVDVEVEQDELDGEAVEVDMQDLCPIVKVESAAPVEMEMVPGNLWEMEPEPSLIVPDSLEAAGSNIWSRTEVGPEKVET